MEYNFFAPLSARNRNKVIMLISSALAVILCISLSAGLYQLLAGYSSQLETEIKEMDVSLKDPKTSDTVQRASILEKKLDIMNGYLAAVGMAWDKIGKSNKIRMATLDNIRGGVNPGIVLDSISITQESTVIKGAAKSWTDITLFRHSLALSGVFSDVLAESIESKAENEAGYAFTIQCTFKEVGKK